MAWDSSISVSDLYDVSVDTVVSGTRETATIDGTDKYRNITTTTTTTVKEFDGVTETEAKEQANSTSSDWNGISVTGTNGTAWTTKSTSAQKVGGANKWKVVQTIVAFTIDEGNWIDVTA